MRIDEHSFYIKVAWRVPAMCHLTPPAIDGGARSIDSRRMSRILVAVSTAWASQRLVEPVADIATRMKAEVVVAHISRPSGGQLREQEQSDGEAALKLLADKLKGRGIEVQTLLTFADDIAHAILNTAAERNVTMIILGLTGKNVFARLIAGNVPVELIRETRVPVLLIPPDWDSTF